MFVTSSNLHHSIPQSNDVIFAKLLACINTIFLVTFSPCLLCLLLYSKTARKSPRESELLNRWVQRYTCQRWREEVDLSHVNLKMLSTPVQQQQQQQHISRHISRTCSLGGQSSHHISHCYCVRSAYSPALIDDPDVSPYVRLIDKSHLWTNATIFTMSIHYVMTFLSRNFISMWPVVTYYSYRGTSLQ